MALHFTIVTGNQHKLDEYHRLLPPTIQFDSAQVELEELQTLDPRELIEHKVREAYEIVGKPVLVEDISAGLDTFEGLPGPFIKFFEQQLGKGALYKLAGEQEAAATVLCTIGMYNGKQLIVAQGLVHGIVVSPRGEGPDGWGFDFVFVPAGQTQTYAEMGAPQKAKLSHRALAVKDLLRQLNKL
jgi:non-canonical purine NTP pyrophosphatase (RdgB/HAM1 family)